MSFKLAVLFTLVAAISCATFNSREQVEHIDNRDSQHGILIQQKDQRRFNDQDRFEENRQFQNQNRFENERHNQDRFDNDRHFNEQIPTLVYLEPAVFNLQSSSRHFNVKDDANYDVAYSVSDVTTGDIKTHQETRRGDEVQGQYTIVDSDGFQRKVIYRANDRDGFDAEVKREPIVNFESANKYQGQQNFNNNQHFGNNQFHQNQQVQIVTIPKSVATTSVSKTEDGQRNQYTTITTTN